MSENETTWQWKCPTCGSCDVPEAWKLAQQEWRELDDDSRQAVGAMLATLHLHGPPSDRAWSNGLWSALRALCPAIVEALDGETKPGDFLPIFPED